jgi:hypothetical protein
VEVSQDEKGQRTEDRGQRRREVSEGRDDRSDRTVCTTEQYFVTRFSLFLLKQRQTLLEVLYNGTSNFDIAKLDTCYKKTSIAGILSSFRSDCKKNHRTSLAGLLRAVNHF